METQVITSQEVLTGLQKQKWFNELSKTIQDEILYETTKKINKKYIRIYDKIFKNGFRDFNIDNFQLTAKNNLFTLKSNNEITIKIK